MEWSKRPFVLTLLAPAEQCNQKCPSCYLTKVQREPVTSFALSPENFRQAVVNLSENNIRILTVSFQGYEVTLPNSWPYVESVFKEARKLDIRRSFVTNGMRLHAHVERIVEHDPARIGVSLDGADSETNDYYRGLRGAFKRTLKSLDIFLEAAPQLRDRIAIVSVLYEASNAVSLMKMPKLLADRGLTNWGLGLEISTANNGSIRLASDPRKLSGILHDLQTASAEQGVSFFIGDDFGLIDPQVLEMEAIKRVPTSVEFLRLLPSGHISWGEQAMKDINQPGDPIWHPDAESFISFLERYQSIRDTVNNSNYKIKQRAV